MIDDTCPGAIVQVIAAAAGRPVVLLLIGDDCSSIDHLIAGSDAVIKAFYPSTQGAKAIASSLFGHENRWGKISRRRDCHFAGTTPSSLLKRQLKGEGGAAE